MRHGSEKRPVFGSMDIKTEAHGENYVRSCRNGTHHASFFVWRKRKNLRAGRKLHVGGIEGISCQHFQVIMTNLLQNHWEWQEDRRPMFQAWQRGAIHDVLGEHGHQDSLRCGETEAHRPKYDGS